MKRKCEDSTQHVQLQALRVKAAELIATAGESNGEGKAKYKKAPCLLGWKKGPPFCRNLMPQDCKPPSPLQIPKVVKDFIDAGGATDDLIVRIGTQFFGCPAAKTSQGPVEDWLRASKAF